ncbi:MAG: HU family DNA-binding protein [Bacteroides sp.]|nr:HU family DNA-binding protein [Bacteroides sp.]
MNEKLNIQDFVELLAQKHGMSKEDANNFVKEFFSLIEETLGKDRYVKIKGLGTFKLIGVESRESIHVNTGERFQIQGHTKISFTPEPSLKDLVNKPFAHFETVPLNEETQLEDTLSESDESHEEVIVSSGNAPDFPAETEPQEGMAAPAESLEAQEPEVKSTSFSACRVPSHENSSKKFFAVIVTAVVLIGIAAIAFLCHPEWLDSSEGVSTQKEQVAVVVPATQPDNLQNEAAKEPIEEITHKDTVTAQAVKKTKTTEVASKNEPFKVDSVNYMIMGTDTVYTIKKGETLTKVALRFWGTKALWPYLVKHNPTVIKNPDNVPYGTTIKIPVLKRKTGNE